MTTTFNFKNLFDIPEWRPLAPTISAHVAGGALVSDPRGNNDADPYLYQLSSATGLNRFSPRNNGHVALASPGLAGTFGAGACAVVHPTQGPRGTLTTGNTTTTVVLSTVVPAAVGINQLANRGDGIGYKIRIIGSGKTEEKRIVGNSAGTTPTIWLDSALSFTPASGDTYEIISGRVFLLSAGTVAAGIWKYYDIATNSYSGNLATTNLPATISTDSAMIAMSESNVPNDKVPGQGFYGNLTATATAAGTITGQASGGDAAAAANQWRNFQIRIVQDTTTPTAVGQRRRIASHTAGASAVYTLANNWTVTPSSNAIFVIEYDDDKVLLWSSGTTTTFTYNITANTWDTTTFAAKGSSTSSGSMAFGAWGITPDVGLNSRQSMIHVFRGGGLATVDILDIAGGANGTWENAAVVGGNPFAFATGACGEYDPNTNGGRYAYINSTGQRIDRYDMLNRTMEPYAYLPVAQGGSVVGARMATALFVDGAAKMTALHLLSNVQTNLWQLWVHN